MMPTCLSEAMEKPRKLAWKPQGKNGKGRVLRAHRRVEDMRW